MNISHQLFDNIILFVNPQNSNTNTKGNFVRFKDLIYKYKSIKINLKRFDYIYLISKKDKTFLVIEKEVTNNDNCV